MAHLLTCEEMRLLDTIEAGYDRVPLTCVLYDASVVVATGYVMKKNSDVFMPTVSDKPPSTTRMCTAV